MIAVEKTLYTNNCTSFHYKFTFLYSRKFFVIILILSIFEPVKKPGNRVK